ncbi:hypothetical protein POG22_15255 [Geitlerinema sp. CS-897]|nr:hypothetical protein [Baaleninema simplex]MDC0834349.1 hypothetical protein [Geitlerinema sp. CS-897]
MRSVEDLHVPEAGVEVAPQLGRCGDFALPHSLGNNTVADFSAIA